MLGGGAVVGRDSVGLEKLERARAITPPLDSFSSFNSFLLAAAAILSA